MRLPFVQLKQDAIVKARTMARLLKIPAYAGIGLAGELFVWALDMAPEFADGTVDWSGDLGKEDPAPLVAAAVGWEGDPEQLLAAFVRVGFVQAPDRHLRKNARVRGLDCYEATHTKALKDRDRKRVQRKSDGSREDGAGQTQTQTHKKLLDPPADLGSGETQEPRFDVEHWKDDVEQLVVWMVCTRDLRGKFKHSTDADVAKTREWAVAWFLKHEPDELALDQMRRAFVGFLDDPWAQNPDRDARLSIWCADNVGLHRWTAERAADEPARRAS